jgi:hypothetical protein
LNPYVFKNFAGNMLSKFFNGPDFLSPHFAVFVDFPAKGSV